MPRPHSPLASPDDDAGPPGRIGQHSSRRSKVLRDQRIRWLIVGWLFAAVCHGVLVPMTFLPAGAGIALPAAIAVVVPYEAMVVARLVN